jgi:hypothetical protein
MKKFPACYIARRIVTLLQKLLFFRELHQLSPHLSILFLYDPV